jgi:integrative and conjugative element protein (TIGR02256 family)
MPRVPSGVLTPVSGDRFILVAESVAARIFDFVERDGGALEAGGVLLGLRRDPHIEVVSATFPSSGDVRRRYRFSRGSKSHQRAATRAWAESGKLIDYVGEWHTHPEDCPSPSGLDRIELLRRTREHGEPLVELIVGRTATVGALAYDGKYASLKWIDA